MTTETAIVAVAVCLVFAPVTWRLWRPAPPKSAPVLTRVTEALGRVLGPRVNLTGSGVLAAPCDIGELALGQRILVVETEHRRTLPLGMFCATIELRGSYRCKVGIDVSGVSGRFDRTGRLLRMTVPHSRLLTVEPVSTTKPRRSDSPFNRATPADCAAALAVNLDQARVEAGNPNILAEADRQLARRLGQALAPLGVRVVVSFANTSRTIPLRRHAPMATGNPKAITPNNIVPMPRPNHYVPAIDRFMVKVLWHEARHRNIPMTKLVDLLLRDSLRGSTGWQLAAGEAGADDTGGIHDGRKAA